MRRDLAKELDIRVRLSDDSVPTINSAKEKDMDTGLTSREQKQVSLHFPLILQRVRIF